ncbi:MAG: tetratricopeptide repeat-containing sulfotransferase family protein [Isosphaerales bacterium]
MSTKQDVLDLAVDFHQAGELARAARLYRKILAREPANPEALHLCGVLHHQRGHHSRAVELIGRAVALRPESHVFQANLAEAHRAVGDYKRAVACCHAALRISPDWPEALCNLGAALQGMGRHAESAARLSRALELRPDMAMARNNLGVALRDQGQVQEALEQFQRAVELDPAFAPTRTNFGLTLLSVGRTDEALAHAQEAVRLDPELAELHHNLGNVLRALNRPAEARPCYVEALRLNPNLALTCAHLGLVLQSEGYFKWALVRLRKATELEPENATFWEWLAGLHEEREEHGDAIPCWERALDLEPDRAQPHLSLGWDLQEEGRLKEAHEHYLTAIQLQPDSHQARMSLGALHEELGELAEAEAAFREALQLQPSFPLPHGRLATLLRGKLPEADLAALEERLRDNGLDQGPRARLLFGLGHVLDGRGDYHRASDCVREANAITLEMGRGRRAYAPIEHERYVDGLLRAFDQGFFERMAGTRSDTRRPVFVVGLPRSGTTLTEQVLASHSQIHGAGELRLARQTFDSVPGVLGRSDPPSDCVAHLDEAAVEQLAAQHLSHLDLIDGGRAARIVDKMPDNYMYLGLLSVIFPHAVFIHCRRNLHDVALSCFMTDFRALRWANHPDHIAARFRNYRRLMDHWRAVPHVPIVDVDYEETVSDLESVARRMVAACGLDWEPACLDFYRNERPVRTASLTQVRQPIYQRSVARWKHYESTLSELFAALPPDDRELGPG